MQNRKLAWAVALSAVVAPLTLLMAPAGASGNVPRYEIQTLKFTVDLNGQYTHYFTATLNPCNGTFSGTGYNASDNEYSPLFKQETISGTYLDNELSYVAIQDQGTPGALPWSPLPWGTVSPVSIDSSGSGGPALAWLGTNSGSTSTGWTITVSDVSAVDQFTMTHGQYVSAGLASPDSCLGMPKVAMG